MALQTVQNWQGGSTSLNTISVVLLNTLGGDQLFAIFYVYAGGAPISTPVVSDNISNNWQLVVQGGTSATGIVYLYFCASTLSTSVAAINVTSANATKITLLVAEMSFGLGAKVAVSGGGSFVSAVNSTTMQAGTISPAYSANGMVIAGFFSGSSTATIGAPLFNYVASSDGSVLAENVIVPAGNYNATATQSGSSNYIGVAAGFGIAPIVLQTSAIYCPGIPDSYPPRARENVNFDSLLGHSIFTLNPYGPPQGSFTPTPGT